MYNFCTLFDSCYLDKGLALYNSLARVTDNFTLYIFCLDDTAYKILRKMPLKHAVLIQHKEFETPTLLKLKCQRSKAEYCWTCTAPIIEYVFNTFQVANNTYLDADLYFFSDPSILFEEISAHKANVTIVAHRFKDNRYGRKLEKRNGKYCVQFNYFDQSEDSMKVLNWWKEKCFEWCYDIPEPDRMGDQKYLNTWLQDFNCVHELEYLGGGVAPWNLEQYEFCLKKGSDLFMQDKNGREFKLIFYHFQNIRYLPGRKVNIKSQTRNKKLKYTIYLPYLLEIEKIRADLATNYGLDLSSSKIIRSSNPLIGFLQKHFAAFKIQSLSDILNLDHLKKYEVLK